MQLEATWLANPISVFWWLILKVKVKVKIRHGHGNPKDGCVLGVHKL